MTTSEAAVIEIATKWATTSGLNLERYTIKISDLQTCPEGCFTVEVKWKSKSELSSSSIVSSVARKSRILEVNPATKCVEAVLAWRDADTLRRMMILEETNEAQDKKPV